jgi:hypothetical protein
MAIITKNFAAEWEQLKAEWDSLSICERRRQWDAYTDAIDHGEAGWHAYHRVLEPLWAVGLEV